MENTPSRSAILRANAGTLAHSNHYVHPELQECERADEVWLANSRRRLARMRALLSEQYGKLDPPAIAEILRDRHDAPDALSVLASDVAQPGETPYMTVTSVIAEPAAGRIWVTPGPPSEARYTEYSFGNEQGMARDAAF